MINLIKPKVELIPQPRTIEDAYKFLELVGRVCYKSENRITEESAENFLVSLYKRGHLSIFAHLTTGKHAKDLRRTIEFFKGPTNGDHKEFLKALIGDMMCAKLTDIYPTPFTFRITCSRSCSHQLVRHETSLFAQESMRYCNYKGNVTVIEPLWLKDLDTSIKEEYLSYLEKSSQAYDNLILSGLKPEQARGVLPQDVKTELIMTFPRILVTSNGKDIDLVDHFLKLRLDPHAQDEIRFIAKEINALTNYNL